MAVLNNVQERYSNDGKACGPTRTTWPPAWLLELESASQAAAPSPEVELLAAGELDVAEVAAMETKPDSREPEPAHETDDVLELDWTEIVPCPTCGSLEKWWNMAGQERCLNCEFPSRAMDFLQKASNSRQLANRKAW